MSEKFMRRFYKTFKIPPFSKGGIYDSNPNFFNTLLSKLASTLENGSIYALDNSRGHLIHYFTTEINFPLSHRAFFQEAKRQVQSYPEIEIKECYYEEGDASAHFILYRKDQADLEYQPGAMFFNDETYAVSCRLVIRGNLDNSIYYLPARSYNLSSARYLKRASSSLEAFSILFLRVVGDMLQKESWASRIVSFLDNYDKRINTPITYEEYSRVLLAMKRVSAIYSEGEASGEDLTEFTPLLTAFLKDYPALEEKSHSYLYRCTSVLDSAKIVDLLNLLIRFTSSAQFSPKDLMDIRYIMGELVMEERLVSDIARK